MGIFKTMAVSYSNDENSQSLRPKKGPSKWLANRRVLEQTLWEKRGDLFQAASDPAKAHF